MSRVSVYLLACGSWASLKVARAETIASLDEGGYCKNRQLHSPYRKSSKTYRDNTSIVVQLFLGTGRESINLVTGHNTTAVRTSLQSPEQIRILVGPINGDEFARNENDIQLFELV